MTGLCEDAGGESSSLTSSPELPKPGSSSSSSSSSAASSSSSSSFPASGSAAVSSTGVSVTGSSSSQEILRSSPVSARSSSANCLMWQRNPAAGSSGVLLNRFAWTDPGLLGWLHGTEPGVIRMTRSIGPRLPVAGVTDFGRSSVPH